MNVAIALAMAALCLFSYWRYSRNGIRYLLALGVVAGLLAGLSLAPHAAVDRGVCTAADQAGCTGTNLKANTTEEIGALWNAAPLVATSVTGANAITACATPSAPALVDGQLLQIKPAGANTAAVTLNWCGIGVKAVSSNAGTALVANDLLGTNIYLLRWFASNNEWRVMNASVTQPAFVTKISGSSGNAGAFHTAQSLSADAAAVTTTSLTTVMSTANLAAGTYQFRYMVRYQSAALTTGLAIVGNFTGTVTTFESQWFNVSTGTTVATGVADQDASTLVGQYVEGKAARAVNTASSTSAGVDTANADMLAVFEGIFIAGSSGTLELRIASEVAASAITVKAGTSLLLTKMD